MSYASFAAPKRRAHDGGCRCGRQKRVPARQARALPVFYTALPNTVRQYAEMISPDDIFLYIGHASSAATTHDDALSDLLMLD